MDHPPGFRWLHESFGTNWRLTEMQSAIGRIQLAKMSEWTHLRGVLAEKLVSVLCNFSGVRVPVVPEDIKHANYKLYVFVEPTSLNEGWSRDRIIEALNSNGVPVMQGSCSEVYLEKAFEGKSFKPVERLPVARELGETSLMFLVHPTISMEQMDKVCECVSDVMNLASK
jgi:dTDP-4-amino-4,6-dideoxygalactose transaminase